MKKMFTFIFVFGLLLSGCELLPAEITSALINSITTPSSIQATVIPSQIIPAVEDTIVEPTSAPEIIHVPTSVVLTEPPDYIPQTGSPFYEKNFLHTEVGCNWMGIAGQIFGAAGKPQINLVVIVTGKLGDKIIDQLGVSGAPQADPYGPGGYKIRLADAAVASQGSLAIQVLDLEGKPLSEAVSFDTFEDCHKNLMVFNFHLRQD